MDIKTDHLHHDSRPLPVLTSAGHSRSPAELAEKLGVTLDELRTMSMIEVVALQRAKRTAASERETLPQLPPSDEDQELAQEFAP